MQAWLEKAKKLNYIHIAIAKHCKNFEECHQIYPYHTTTEQVSSFPLTFGKVVSCTSVLSRFRSSLCVGNVELMNLERYSLSTVRCCMYLEIRHFHP